MIVRRARPESPIDRIMPRSEYHERAAIGCMLEGYDNPYLIPERFAHPGRQVLFMGLRAMRDCRALLIPRRLKDIRGMRRANAVRLCKVVMKANLWDCAGSLPNEAEQCLDACTQGLMIDWHARKLMDLSLRRNALEASERLAALATRPTADLSGLIRELKLAEREAERLQSLEKRLHSRNFLTVR